VPTVFIRHNATGEAATMAWPHPWQDWSPYMWGHGNYACDCNRAIFFAEATGREDPPCSDGAFSVRITDDDGRELFSDMRQP
jgi:hypothetical protein